MHKFLHLLLLSIPNADQVTTFAATVIVAALCVGLGWLVGARRPAGALVAGWGAGGLVLMVLGTLTPVSFPTGLMGLAALGLVGLLIALRHGFEPGGWVTCGRVGLLAIPLLSVIASIAPSQFDEFSHWLPNLGYLYLFGHFPTLALPNLASFRPGYPYGQAFIGLAVSLFHGRLDESAGIVWNGLLLVGVGVIFTDVLALCLRGVLAPVSKGSMQDWGLAAIGLLIATTLNPIFSPKLVFTNYGDAAVGSVVAIMIGTLMLGTFGAGLNEARSDIKTLSATGFCAAALVNIRQDSLELFFIFLLGVAIWVLSVRRLGGRGLIGVSGFVLLVPALIVAGLWRHYVATEIPGGAFVLLTPDKWRWFLLPSALHQILIIFVQKIGYFSLLAFVCVMAIRVFLRPDRFTALQRQSLILGATIGIGQILFLLVAYLMANFTEAEAAAANSFWRFSNHAGLSVSVAAITLLPLRRFLETRRASIIAVGLAFLSPILALPWLKFDATVHEPYLRTVGNDLAALTKGASSVTLFDYQIGQATILPVRYQIMVADRASAQTPIPKLNIVMDVPSTAYFINGAMPVWDSPGAKNDRDLATALAAPFIWFYDGGDIPSKAVGMNLPKGSSYLLERQDGKLRIVRQWLIPQWRDKTTKYL